VQGHEWEMGRVGEVGKGGNTKSPLHLFSPFPILSFVPFSDKMTNYTVQNKFGKNFAVIDKFKFRRKKKL
jgi:hypothetical protein